MDRKPQGTETKANLTPARPGRVGPASGQLDADLARTEMVAIPAGEAILPPPPEVSDHPLKTYDEWSGNLGTYLQIGDRVDEEMVRHFLEIVPPVCQRDALIQLGEPTAHTGGAYTYPTLHRVGSDWMYAGNCHRGKTSQPEVSSEAQGSGEPVRTSESVREELREVELAKSRHDQVGSTYHFAESMAYNDRISALDRELSALMFTPPVRWEDHEPRGVIPIWEINGMTISGPVMVPEVAQPQSESEKETSRAALYKLWHHARILAEGKPHWGFYQGPDEKGRHRIT